MIHHNIHASVRKLASESALYGLSSIVGRALNYLLVPFYTSIFSPAEYGVITAWYAYAAFLQVLYTYGMETAYFRFASQDHKYFHTATSLLCITSTIFSGVLVVFASAITDWLGYAGATYYVYYFAAILAVDTVLAIPLARLRLQQRALRFVGAKLLQIILNVLLNVVWLYVLPLLYSGPWQPWVSYVYDPDRHIAYVFMANLVANAATLPWVVWGMPRLQWHLSWQYVQPLLRYALPLLLIGLASTVNEMLSRAALQHWLPVGFYVGQSNEAILGMFGACYKLSIFMSLGIQAFRYAAEPLFFSQAQDRHAPALFGTVMYWFVVVGCFVLFAISVNLDLLAYLLLRHADYHGALPVVPYLLLAYLLLGVYYNLSIWFKLTHKTHYGVLITGLGATVTIVGNALLIPQIGYWGCVWAILASYATMCGLCYYWGQRYYPVPYAMRLGIAYIAGTMCLVILARGIVYPDMAYAVVTNLLLTAAFGMALYKVSNVLWSIAGLSVVQQNQEKSAG